MTAYNFIELDSSESFEISGGYVTGGGGWWWVSLVEPVYEVACGIHDGFIDAMNKDD